MGEEPCRPGRRSALPRIRLGGSNCRSRAGTGPGGGDVRSGDCRRHRSDSLSDGKSETRSRTIRICERHIFAVENRRNADRRGTAAGSSARDRNSPQGQRRGVIPGARRKGSLQAQAPKKRKAFPGLRKMTLNNMVEDFSLIHERLTYEAFRAAGIAAPRTGFAFVRVNGDDFGISLNIENLDKVNLERWFGPFDDPQHLYEGEYGTDVKPGETTKFEVDEGDEEERSDLEALIATANASEGSGWSSQVAPVADLGQMTRMWAVEKYIGHWDGYSGRAGAKQPNNYFLYSSPTGVFQMLPWGTDMTWEERLAFDGPAGLLFDKCLADPACLTLYRKELRAVGNPIAGLGLDSLGKDTAKLLKPWEEADPRLEFPGLVDGAVSETLAFIAARPAELASWLDSGTADGSTSGGSGGEGGSRLVRIWQPPLFVAVRRHPPAASAGVLRTRFRFSAAGRVTQTATIETAKGRANACSVHAQVPGAGGLTIRCPLSRSVRRRLRHRWLNLSLRTRFVPRAGGAETIVGNIHLHRTASG